MKKNILLLTFCIFHCFACNHSDVLNHLGNGYYYMSEGTMLKMIFLSHNEKEANHDKISIYPTVESFVADDDFIIARQVPNKEGVKWIFYPFTDIQVDSLIKNDLYFEEVFANKINYWIIEKKKHKVFGPYNELDFNKKKNDLNISEKMIFGKLPDIPNNK